MERRRMIKMFFIRKLVFFDRVDYQWFKEMLVFFDHTPLPYNNCIIKGNDEKTWQLLAVEKSYQTREDDGNDARNTRAYVADA